MDFYKRYSKYQWVNVGIEKNTKDFRIDSYRPDINSLKAISSTINSNNGWSKRKELVLPTISNSLEQIVLEYEKEKVSLGIIKPKKIIDFKIESINNNWSPKHQDILNQFRLFEPQPKELMKIPFKFSYVFVCDDSTCDKPHKLSIIDWEIFALYLTLKNKYGYSMDVILEKIKAKWFTEMCGIDKDTHLIVGSRFPTPTFMVLGVFWPPKTK